MALEWNVRNANIRGLEWGLGGLSLTVVELEGDERPENAEVQTYVGRGRTSEPEKSYFRTRVNFEGQLGNVMQCKHNLDLEIILFQ